MLKKLGVFGFSLFLLAIVLAQPGSVQAVGKGYYEVGDAGDSLGNPQFITGGPYDGIIGSFGVDTDVDVFAFYWIGGDFLATFSPTAAFDPEVALFNFSQNPLGSASGTGVFQLSIDSVPAGNYLLRIFQSPPSGSSDYTVTFAPVIPVQPTVPEPATMLLLGSGLLGLWGARKKFRK
jgi:hypothetical protein